MVIKTKRISFHNIIRGIKAMFFNEEFHPETDKAREDPDLHNIRMIEDFLYEKTDLYKGICANFGVCACGECGQVRRIYMTDIQRRCQYCYDCAVRNIVDLELSRGTDKNIVTKAYLAGNGYMTVMKQFERYIEQQKVKGNPSPDEDF